MGQWRALVAASNYHMKIHNNKTLNISEIIYVGAFKAKIMICACCFLSFLANACTCRDLSSDCNFQVSFLCDKAAVMYDDIDRMQLELTDLDFAIRTSIDDYAEQKQKLAYEHSNLSSLKIRSNIELVGVVEKEKRIVQFLQIKQQYMASSPWPV